MMSEECWDWLPSENIGNEIASPAFGGLAMTMGKEMAERERFELSIRYYPYGGLANRCLKPG